jgi:hypothetical protein
VQRAATVMQDDADIGLGAVHQPSRRERLARLESQARRAHGRRRRRPCAARERPDIGHTGGHCPGAAGGRGLRDALANSTNLAIAFAQPRVRAGPLSAASAAV